MQGRKRGVKSSPHSRNVNMPRGADPLLCIQLPRRCLLCWTPFSPLLSGLLSLLTTNAEEIVQVLDRPWRCDGI